MTDYYVSPAGDDAHPGTRARPLASFQPLSSPDARLAAGDTVHVRGGTIRSRGVDLCDVRGRPEAPISIVADGDATPVVDCSGGDGHGFELDGCAGVAIRGIAIRGAARHGVRISGRSSGRITIEGVDVHGHARSGNGDAIHATGGADLLVRGCYLRQSHRNAGRESRGLAIESFSGRCDVLASEFYRNAGGGAAVVGDSGRTRLRRCIAHRNGFGEGEPTGFDVRDRTGFDSEARSEVPGVRIDGAGVLDRCIAYYNGGPGFLCGDQSRVVHATAWANAGVGYRWSDGGGDPTNCLATANLEGPVAGRDGEVAGVIAVPDPAFRSTDDTDSAFLEPRADSPLVDAGDPRARSEPPAASDPGARQTAPAPDADGTELRPGEWLAHGSTVLRDWRRRLDADTDPSSGRLALY